jgi:hypothetical protein
MQRLLCFLSDIERALAADDPSPGDGSWENARTVNYSQAIARVLLNARLPAGTLEARGAITVQAYTLADGTACLKANLTWAGSTAETVRSIYTKPGTNWTSEARRLAALWMGGAPAEATVTALEAEPAKAALVQVG